MTHNQRTTMKNLRNMNFLIVLAFLAVLFQPLQADAYPGCDSKVRLQVDPWHETMLYHYLSGPYPRVGDVQTEARLGYYNCPNGDRRHKVKPLWIEACWFNPDEHQEFNGVEFRFNVFDDSGRGWNTGPFKVADDNSDRNCERVYANGVWLHLKQDPRWRGSGKVETYLTVDSTWEFRTANGKRNNMIKVREAEILGPWHW